MAKDIKFLMFYIISLLICSLLLSWLNLNYILVPFNYVSIEITPMVPLAILGGMFFLKFTLPAKTLFFFIVIYCSLLLIRGLFFFVVIQFEQINIFKRIFHPRLIAYYYYKEPSPLGTPLPFVVFWLVNHVVLILQKQRAIEKE